MSIIKFNGVNEEINPDMLRMAEEAMSADLRREMNIKADTVMDNCIFSDYAQRCMARDLFVKGFLAAHTEMVRL